MVLHSSPLTVELVVDGPGEVALGAVEAALAAGTQLLSSALGEAEDVALREHNVNRTQARTLRLRLVLRMTVGFFSRRADLLGRFGIPARIVGEGRIGFSVH